jgi:hypothetical protein
MSKSKEIRIEIPRAIFLIMSEKNWELHLKHFGPVVGEYFPLHCTEGEFHLHLLDLPLMEISRQVLEIIIKKEIPSMLRIEYKDTIHDTFNYYRANLRDGKFAV